MSTPGFSPRSYAVEPKDFGRKHGIEWKQVEEPIDRDRLVAAQIQHQYALKINRRARELGISIKKLAAREDTNSARSNGRMLRGEVCIRLEYIAQADRVLGNIL